MNQGLSLQEQIEYLTDGVDTVLPEDVLRERLAEGRPLRVKLGVDPTAPDVTLGWAVVFRQLRKFQELGHTAVLIVGDFTAQVGDPSERAETRKRLDASEVEGYVFGVTDTIRRLLLEENLEIRYNSEWLGTMSMSDVLDLTSKFTISRIMDREDFAKRWATNQPISFVEFMYPLLQAMDSVAVEADIEIGGSDQLFNLLVGRDLQERSGQTGQLVMTVPLLVGTDGKRKMSQSLGNYISVNDSPEEMFGKTMSIPDEAIIEWFALAAGYSEKAVEKIDVGLRTGDLHPGDTKRLLGREIITLYHREKEAHTAEASFDRIFRQHETPEEIDEFYLTEPDSTLVAVLAESEIVSSRSEARRLIRQGAVRIDGNSVIDERMTISGLGDVVVQVGKRRFIRLRREPK